MNTTAMNLSQGSCSYESLDMASFMDFSKAAGYHCNWMSELASVSKTFLKCSACRRFTGDHIQFMCPNGHNVCLSCKCRDGQDIPCPRCGSDFHSAAASSVVVKDLIDFETPCKYQTTSGCTLSGVGLALSSHEDACKSQIPLKVRIECPCGGCQARITFDEVLKHYLTAHGEQLGDVDSDTGTTH